MLKLLVEFGATYNPENITSCTPLMLTVIKGDELDVWKELQRSSDVNEKNQRGRNAIIYAALARHEAGVEALLEANADVHSEDEHGMTALCAAYEGGTKRKVKLLRKSGADVQHRIVLDEQRFPLQLRASMRDFYRYYKATGLIVTRKMNLIKMKPNFADSSLLQGPA